jgi:oligoendopeptidase F
MLFQPAGHLLGNALDAAFLLSLDDHKDAWERYLKLVRRAGLASYTELLQTAGLKVPFEEGSVKGIAQQMTRWLEEHQVD